LNQLIWDTVKSNTEFIITCLQQMTEKDSCTLESWWACLNGELRKKKIFFQVFLKYCIVFCYLA
jgi:hypothetical protein